MLKLNKQRLNLERWLNHKHHIHGTYDLKKKKRKPKTQKNKNDNAIKNI